MNDFFKSNLISYEESLIARELANLIGEEKLKNCMKYILLSPKSNQYFRSLISDTEVINFVHKHRKIIDIINDNIACKADAFIDEVLGNNYIFANNDLCNYEIAHLSLIDDEQEFRMQETSKIYTLCMGWYMLYHLSDCWCLWRRTQKLPL